MYPLLGKSLIYLPYAATCKSIHPGDFKNNLTENLFGLENEQIASIVEWRSFYFKVHDDRIHIHCITLILSAVHCIALLYKHRIKLMPISTFSYLINPSHHI